MGTLKLGDYVIANNNNNSFYESRVVGLYKTPHLLLCFSGRVYGAYRADSAWILVTNQFYPKSGDDWGGMLALEVSRKQEWHESLIWNK